ncbi:MAG: radical SAM protein [Saprospiraceae bacterium]|nr:radical SAM protein [Saprospiraceae bacterium]
MHKSKNYTYYDYTKSLCAKCLKTVDTKIVFENDHVYMHKFCKEHGFQKSLIATDIEYYKQIRNYNKASEYPLHNHTETLHGCPLDCGLCPDHEQHSCLTIIEVTDRCNLSCPTCYANSAPGYGRHRTLEEIEEMFDIIVASEGEPDVIQISGGEPTIHPQFWDIMDMAKTKPVKHLMLNTNGIRIAKDRAFTERLASYMPDFEVYLQFDSLERQPIEVLRGADLLETRFKALEHLNEFNLSTTLVVTLAKGLNDGEMGKIIDFALSQKCVRGVTFQPTQVAGRTENFNPETDRLTLTEVRTKILEQSPVFQPADIIPVPCNPDAIAMAYALKVGGEVFPLTHLINPEDLLNNSKNTIVYEQDEVLRDRMLEIFSTGNSVDALQEEFHHLLCCLPNIVAPELSYNNLFRIIIMNFVDAYDFDVRSIKKSCVHIVHKDGRVIPFETMNLFYRDELETYTNQLKQEAASLMTPQKD